MNKQILTKLETMLTEARNNRTWGCIEIDLKDGLPVLVRQTTQEKIAHEEYPSATKSLNK